MGGVVSHPLTQPTSQEMKEATEFLNGNFGGSIGPFTGSTKIAFVDFPLHDFDQLQSLLPLCVQSWNYVVKTRVNGKLLGDIFQMEVIRRVKAMRDPTGSIMEEVLLSSKDVRSHNPVTAAMRYCVRTRRVDDQQFRKKLALLGREHARIGISADLIVCFCEILVSSFAACLQMDPMINLDQIMYAWAANMKYIVTHMTSTRYSFLRVCSNETVKDLESNDNDELSSATAAFGSEGSCGSNKGANNMFKDYDVGPIEFDFDGLSHNCHPIPELVNSAEISLLCISTKTSPIWRRNMVSRV